MAKRDKNPYAPTRPPAIETLKSAVDRIRETLARANKDN